MLDLLTPNDIDSDCNWNSCGKKEKIVKSKGEGEIHKQEMRLEEKEDGSANGIRNMDEVMRERGQEVTS